MIDIAFEYVNFYKRYAINWWDHISPGEYLSLLIMVGVFGYLLMMRCGSNKPT